MTAKRWPILDLAGDATETQIRKAYAARLREQGLDADIARFQALRTEFECALAIARREPAVGNSRNVNGTMATRLARNQDRSHGDDAPDRSNGDDAPLTLDEARERMRDNNATRSAEEAPERIADNDARRFADEASESKRASAERSAGMRVETAVESSVQVAPEAGARALEHIRRLLAEGDLPGACERYDLARATGDIGLAQESVIEYELAEAWLADATLGAAEAARIARRYRWDDAVSTFALGSRVVAKLQTNAVPTDPAARFIGKWNWGAFCLTPFWLMAHGFVARGVRLLVYGALLLVVPLGFIGILWVAVDYGRRGNALAVKRRKFADEAEFVAVQNAWRAWGIGIFAGLSACIIGVIAFAIAVSHR